MSPSFPSVKVIASMFGEHEADSPKCMFGECKSKVSVIMWETREQYTWHGVPSPDQT